MVVHHRQSFRVRTAHKNPGVPETRRLMLDREHEVALAVAGFRAGAGRDLAEPDYQELITELIEGRADFAAIWARQDVRGRQEGRSASCTPSLAASTSNSRSSRSLSGRPCISTSIRPQTTVEPRPSCETIVGSKSAPASTA